MKASIVLSTLATLAAPVVAINSSTYIYAQNGANITVSLTAAADTNDLYFRISAPGAYDWVSVGVGASMKGAFTLIAYPNKKGNAMTLSPRQATGNSEPTYNKNIDCKLVGDSNPNSPGDNIDMSIICRNAAQYSSPSLDLSSKEAPFMWALGRTTFKNGTNANDSPSADLRSHSAHATFTIDMTQATVPSNSNDTIPTLGSEVSGASSHSNVETTRDYLSPGHAIATIVALIVLIPLDSMMRMCIKTVKFHIFMYILITILFIVGSALGFAVSSQFNRSKKYNSAHQVLGIIIFFAFFAQIPMGYFSYRRVKAQWIAEQDTQPIVSSEPELPARPRKRDPVKLTHMLIGVFIVLLAVVNGPLGFNLSLTSAYNMYWVVLSVGVFAVLVIASGLRWMLKTRRKDAAQDLEDDDKRKEVIEAYQLQAMRARDQQHQNQDPAPEYYAGGQYPTINVPRSY
ncbi:CBD9-like protein [Microthyrium microscopicum]|uniref:CBD9-like protein n=1 Tax=Microthyrium microscopicum TaxID=703497 RepID=A0A6A6TZL6_9PEZI|nr:CBD9-like protein [Microthyrium microscopicum]